MPLGHCGSLIDPVYIPVAITKILTFIWLYNSRSQPVIAGEVKAGTEAASHMTSAARNQEADPCLLPGGKAQLASLFLTVQGPA